MCTKQYKVVTSGRCSEPPMDRPITDRNNYWIETKAACEEAASVLGKEQTFAYSVETTENSAPPYCTYSNGPDGCIECPDILRFMPYVLSRENTGDCTPQSECICVVYEAAGDSAVADAFGGDALSTMVVVVIAAALLEYFCWQYTRRPRR